MRGWMLFVAGVLAGVAGALLVGGPRGEGRAGGTGGPTDGGGRPVAGSSRSGGDGTGSRSSEERRGTRAGRATSAVDLEGILDYLSAMKQVDDFEEINLMELLRHGHFVTTMSESEVLGLLAQYRDEEASERDEGEMTQLFQALLFTRLAELNGPEALRMVLAGEMSKRFEGDEDELIAMGLGSWVGADPEGAAAWFRGVGRDDAKFQEVLDDRDVQQAFFAAMARHDTRMALEMLHESGGEIAERNLEVIARYERTTEGLEGMLGEAQGHAKHEVFEVLSARDSEAAMQWLASQPAIEERDDYVQTLASELLARDVQEGIEWYMAQEVTPEGAADRYRQVVDHLGEVDGSGTAAIDWLSAQPDSPQRDQAEGTLARHLVMRHDDVDEGFRWAGEISSPQLQQETVQWILARGWDREAGTVPSETAEAARAAGFGEQLDVFLAQAAAEQRARER